MLNTLPSFTPPRMRDKLPTKASSRLTTFSSLSPCGRTTRRVPSDKTATPPQTGPVNNELNSRKTNGRFGISEQLCLVSIMYRLQSQYQCDTDTKPMFFNKVTPNIKLLLVIIKCYYKMFHFLPSGDLNYLLVPIFSRLKGSPCYKPRPQYLQYYCEKY